MFWTMFCAGTVRFSPSPRKNFRPHPPPRELKFVGGKYAMVDIHLCVFLSTAHFLPTLRGIGQGHPPPDSSNPSIITVTTFKLNTPGYCGFSIFSPRLCLGPSALTLLGMRSAQQKGESHHTQPETHGVSTPTHLLFDIHESTLGMEGGLAQPAQLVQPAILTVARRRLHPSPHPFPHPTLIYFCRFEGVCTQALHRALPRFDDAEMDHCSLEKTIITTKLTLAQYRPPADGGGGSPAFFSLFQGIG